MIRTNLTGSWLVSKYVGAYMRSAGKGGSIINISSVSGLNRPQFRGGVGYSSSKAAMDSMTKVIFFRILLYLFREENSFIYFVYKIFDQLFMLEAS